MTQDTKKSGPVCCGQNLRNSCLYQSVGFVFCGLSLGALFSCCWCVTAQAAICFLPDCHEKVMHFEPSGVEQCLAAGYESSSSRICPQYSNIEYCTENSSYIKCNLRQWCLDNNYTLVPDDCHVPEYADTQCPNGEVLYLRCVADYEKACLEEDNDYVNECPDGWILDNDELCSYSNLYGKCCNECEDYPYEKDEIPDGYVSGASCLSCGGISKYKKEVNPCVGYQRCPDGHKSGTDECRHGEETWYKECCAYDCELPSCPEGTECRFEACSNRYCALGCLTDYKDFCTVPIMDCDVLGYSQTECAGSKLICPYDDTKYYCL